MQRIRFRHLASCRDVEPPEGTIVDKLLEAVSSNSPLDIWGIRREHPGLHIAKYELFFD